MRPRQHKPPSDAEYLSIARGPKKYVIWACLAGLGVLYLSSGFILTGSFEGEGGKPWILVGLAFALPVVVVLFLLGRRHARRRSDEDR